MGHTGHRLPGRQQGDSAGRDGGGGGCQRMHEDRLAPRARDHGGVSLVARETMRTTQSSQVSRALSSHGGDAAATGRLSWVPRPLDTGWTTGERQPHRPPSHPGFSKLPSHRRVTHTPRSPLSKQKLILGKAGLATKPRRMGVHVVGGSRKAVTKPAEQAFLKHGQPSEDTPCPLNPSQFCSKILKAVSACFLAKNVLP